MDKTTTLEQALAGIRSGATIMVGGFGVPGTPFTLIYGLLEREIGELTLIKNEANEAGLGISRLIEAGRVSRLITSHLGLNARAIDLMNRGEIEVAFYPQGILAEKIRAGGAGLLGILTDIGIDTILAREKTKIEVLGRPCLVEPSLRADVALIHAAIADRSGNLVYEKSARNFSPLMAMAADRVIVETETLVEIGELDPGRIHTPPAFTDSLVVLDELLPDYGILEHHVL